MDLCHERREAARIEGLLQRRYLVHATAHGPDVRLEVVRLHVCQLKQANRSIHGHFVRKQLGRHVVRRPNRLPAQ